MPKGKMRTRAEIEQAHAYASQKLARTKVKTQMTVLYAQMQALEWVLGDDEFDDIILPTRTD